MAQRKDVMNRAQHAVGLNQVPNSSQNLSQLIQLQELISQSQAGGTGLNKQIKELRTVIPLGLLRAFERATEQGRVAVARITDSGACAGCHLKLPIAVAAKVLMVKNQIHTCPYCGCFLYSCLAPGAAEPFTPPLPHSWHPGRSIRVFRPGFASRLKARPRTHPTTAPSPVGSHQQGTSL